MGREIIAFKKEEIEKLVEKLGYYFSGEGEIMENGEQAKCYSCGTPLTVENLGGLAYGSRHAFCDKPSCYSRYVAETEEE